MNALQISIVTKLLLLLLLVGRPCEYRAKRSAACGHFDTTDNCVPRLCDRIHAPSLHATSFAVFSLCAVLFTNCAVLNGLLQLHSQISAAAKTPISCVNMQKHDLQLQMQHNKRSAERKVVACRFLKKIHFRISWSLEIWRYICT